MKTPQPVLPYSKDMDMPKLSKVSRSDVNIIVSAARTISRWVEMWRFEVKIVKSQLDSAVSRTNNRPGTKFPVGIAVRVT